MVCHDSGLMHVAEAMGKPLIALLGPTDFYKTGPRRSTSVPLYSKGPHFLMMYHHWSMEDYLKKAKTPCEALDLISVESVMESLGAILRKDP